MYKQILRILSSLKRKKILAHAKTCMKCGDIMLRETTTQLDKYYVIPLQLYMVSRVVKLIYTESRMVVARGWWLGGDRELFFIM